MLSCLVYVSVRKKECGPKEIDKILQSCQRNNKGLDITGVLLYTDTHFVQYLEGDYKQISELYEKIKDDKRHNNVVLVANSLLNERVFPSWEMGAKQIGEKNVKFDTYLTYREAETFNKILSGEQANGKSVISILKRFF